MDREITLREKIIEELLNGILSGKFKAGDKLPSEREMAEGAGVSRSIVHLALENLAACGFVEVRPRSGNYVADFMKTGNLATLNLLSGINSGLYEKALRTSLVETRNAIEGSAMITIAKNARQEDLVKLRAMCIGIRDTADGGGTVSEVAKKVKEYHYEIISLSGNMIFTMIMNSFESTGQALWERCVTFWGIEKTLLENERILSLIESGKGEEAADVINEMFAIYKEENAT